MEIGNWRLEIRNWKLEIQEYYLGQFSMTDEFDLWQQLKVYSLNRNNF